MLPSGKLQRMHVVSVYAETTGPIFTKRLHDIVALVALFNHAYTRRYPILMVDFDVAKMHQN